MLVITVICFLLGPGPHATGASAEPVALSHGGAAATATIGRMTEHPAVLPQRPRWQRVLWAVGGAVALVTGIVGIFVPLLPTAPFVLLAAFCFSRGSARCERWLLEHPRFGPLVRDWRERHAVPLRAKQFATLMMAAGSLWAAFMLPARVAWLPAAVCIAVAVWLWRLPTRRT
jgi:uncharacterized membrane protein YbaN (DUF454 family)